MCVRVSVSVVCVCVGVCGVCIVCEYACVSVCVCVKEIKRDTKCDFRDNSWQTNIRAISADSKS